MDCTRRRETKIETGAAPRIGAREIAHLARLVTRFQVVKSVVVFVPLQTRHRSTNWQPFERLCDAFGDKTEQTTPLNAIPIFILATRQIRRLQEREVPDHPLLEERVCQFDKATLDRSDPFFDEVAK